MVVITSVGLENNNVSDVQAFVLAILLPSLIGLASAAR